MLLVAAVAALAVAEPIVQVRKGATPLPNEKPNTFRVDIAFRVQEEAGEDARERLVQVTESLPSQVTLVSGELAHKLTVKTVEVDAAPLDGWTNLEYVVCADQVKFTLKNLTYDVMIRPTRFSVYETTKEDSEVVASEISDIVTLRTALPIPKATLLFVSHLSPHTHSLCCLTLVCLFCFITVLTLSTGLLLPTVRLLFFLCFWPCSSSRSAPPSPRLRRTKLSVSLPHSTLFFFFWLSPIIPSSLLSFMKSSFYLSPLSQRGNCPLQSSPVEKRKKKESKL